MEDLKVERERVLTNVPPDEVELVVKDFESEGAIVIKQREPDGSWTVRAQFLERKAEA